MFRQKGRGKEAHLYLVYRLRLLFLVSVIYFYFILFQFFSSKRWQYRPFPFQLSIAQVTKYQIPNRKHQLIDSLLVMSEKNPNNNNTHTPSADDLNVFDPNVNLPSEPPPSYDEAMADPSIADEDTPSTNSNRPLQTPNRNSNNSTTSDMKYSRPAAPPPSRNSAPTATTATSTKSNSQPIGYGLKYSRPAAPSSTKVSQTTTNTSVHTASGTGAGSTHSFSKSSSVKPTPINPNPYLPWKYPSSYRCSKCDNMGYKKKNGHPCKSCWGRFRPQSIPPSTQSELEKLVKNKPKPKPINSNVVKLPPGATVLPRYTNAPTPMVVQPGDPRIGGIPCPRCNGRGMVHFFLDLERCSNCNGLGRVSFNGRPL